MSSVGDMSTVVWLRRDLRRDDLPVLSAAVDAAQGDRVAVCHVIDPREFDAAGPGPRAWLAATLLALRDGYDGALCLLWGDPARVLPEFASAHGAATVHVTAEHEPVGRRRDDRVAAALASRGIGWVEVDSRYAVAPGEVRTRAGTPFEVFSPFARAWRDHIRDAPASAPAPVRLAAAQPDAQAWARLEAALHGPGVPALPPAGERAARAVWRTFLDEALPGYATRRDRPDLPGTSRLSPYLSLGVLHPRTLLADLAERPGPDADRFITELAWREFYADVTFHHPGSLDRDLRPALAHLDYDQDADLLAAWQQGRTGYPFVDAGMRDLLATGWMHNRARMVTASFLTKDLHVWWPAGARWFLQHLIDGDPASNAHGWQWTAGTGTDAAPYFRVFNPVLQGRRFDPRGDYVRRWIPELAHVAGADVHEPWTVPGGHERGYPTRIVDHAAERRDALERHARARAQDHG